MIPLFLLPNFTWGCWIPGNGENSQVTLSANHIMIYFIPPPHHTTPHTTEYLTGVFQTIQGKNVLQAGSAASLSMTGRYF